MREILFRGIALDTREWVYGSFLRMARKSVIYVPKLSGDGAYLHDEQADERANDEA